MITIGPARDPPPANQPGPDISEVAQLQDTNLVNARGIAFGPTGPLWVGDKGTLKATLYAVKYDESRGNAAAGGQAVIWFAQRLGELTHKDRVVVTFR